jgi:hypothetical protein
MNGGKNNRGMKSRERERNGIEMNDSINGRIGR